MDATHSQYLDETSNILLRKSVIPTGARRRRKNENVLQNPGTVQDKSSKKSFPLTNGSLYQNPDIRYSIKTSKIQFLIKQQDIRSWLSDLRHFQELEINSILISKPIPNPKDE